MKHKQQSKQLEVNEYNNSFSAVFWQEPGDSGLLVYFSLY